jgi:hypothetical protein
MKKIHAVRLRVSDEELTQLQASAKQLGVTSSALLRLHMNNGLSGNCARAARMEARLEGLEHSLTCIHQQLHALLGCLQPAAQLSSSANAAAHHSEEMS